MYSSLLHSAQEYLEMEGACSALLLMALVYELENQLLLKTFREN